MNGGQEASTLFAEEEISLILQRSNENNCTTSRKLFEETTNRSRFDWKEMDLIKAD